MSKFKQDPATLPILRYLAFPPGVRASLFARFQSLKSEFVDIRPCGFQMKTNPGNSRYLRVINSIKMSRFEQDPAALPMLRYLAFPPGVRASNSMCLWAIQFPDSDFACFSPLIGYGRYGCSGLTSRTDSGFWPAFL